MTYIVSSGALNSTHSLTHSIAIMFYALVYDDDDDDAGLSSGVGTNLKVGGTCQARSTGKFFCPPLHFFGFTSTISRFGKRFRGGQYSLITFLFFVLLTLGASVPSHL